VLSKTPTFEYGLYWIGRSASPPQHVAERLLSAGKGAYYVGGWDADDFFVSLARRMDCFPPPFVHRPYSHLRTMLSQLTEYKAPGEDGRFDVTEGTRNELTKVIASHESILTAEYHFLAGEYDQVVTLLRATPIKRLNRRERHFLAWASLMQGNRLAEMARETELESETKAESLHRKAASKFRYATRIAPRLHEAFFNWGNALFDLSLLSRHGAPEMTTHGSAKLLNEAIEKYRVASSISPRDPDVHNNWGNALCDLVRHRRPADELPLLREALRHYRRATSYPSDQADNAYCNWGKALHDLARKTHGAAAKKAFNRAQLNFAIAADINPNNYSVFLSWANALSDAARRSGDEVTYRRAFEKYRRALTIRPGDTAVLWNWARDLESLAHLKTGSTRRRLLREAASKERPREKGA
jgi:tetratricopeptide (TPR) repeat protein